MKLKYLALFLGLGIFMFNSSLVAQERNSTYTQHETSKAKGKPGEPQVKASAEQVKRAALDMTDVLKLVCGVILKKTKHPLVCDVCSAISDPTDPKFPWDTVSCCITAANSFGQIDSSTVSTIKTISGPACSWATCGPSTPGTLLGNICGALDCNTKFDNVTNCLGQLDPKKTCASNFKLPGDCPVCTGDCCPDSHSVYCLAKFCSKGKDGKPQCAYGDCGPDADGKYCTADKCKKGDDGKFRCSTSSESTAIGESMSGGW